MGTFQTYTKENGDKLTHLIMKYIVKPMLWKICEYAKKYCYNILKTSFII